MTDTKIRTGTKGFSFTIDSLLNSPKVRSEPRDEKEELSSISVFHPIQSLEFSRVSIPPLFHVSLPEYNDPRADEEFSDCSNITDRDSPIPSSKKGSYHRLEGKIGMRDISTPRSTTPDSNSSSLCSSTPISEASLESTHSSTNRHKKKARTAFTTDQLDRLEKEYQSKRYLSASERGDLAEELKLTNQQVKTWFQNRRMKEKRQQKDERNQALPFPTGGVDVAELRAHGIPYPLPPSHMGFPPHSTHNVSPMIHPPPHFMSPMSSPYFARDSTAMYSPQPVSLPHHYGYQVPYQAEHLQFPVPPLTQMYLGR